MTNEQYQKIIDIIDKSVEEGDYQNLQKLVKYLNDLNLNNTLYDDSQINDNIDLLTYYLDSFLEELNLGDSANRYLWYECKRKFYGEQFKKYNDKQNKIPLYVFHMLMMEEKDILKIRLWGPTSLAKLKKILSDLELEIGISFTENDQCKLLKYAKDKN